jgi:hypothetical protein
MAIAFTQGCWKSDAHTQQIEEGGNDTRVVAPTETKQRSQPNCTQYKLANCLILSSRYKTSRCISLVAFEACSDFS